MKQMQLFENEKHINNSNESFVFQDCDYGTLNDKVKFLDVCAGIGGGMFGLKKSGFECVGFSEIEKNAISFYNSVCEKKHDNFGDITKVIPDSLPDFDFLIAGFPCQTFSIVGKRQGTLDPRGQIIYSIINILKAKNVKYFILENVKGITSIDQGKTLQNILSSLNSSGFNVHFKILNSINFGVPQLRERAYFVGINKSLKNNHYTFPEPKYSCSDYMISDYLFDRNPRLELNKSSARYETFIKYLNNKYNKGKYSFDDLTKEDYIVIDTRQSDIRIYNNKVPTLRTGRHGIMYSLGGKLRYLSGQEALALQGFPSQIFSTTENIPNNTLLSLAGNAMTVNVINSLSINLIKLIEENNKYKEK